jgi:hypothetical protein
VHIHAEGPAFFSWMPKIFGKKVIVTIHGECEIIRGCLNRDEGTAENERLRDPKFIFSYPKNERLIFLNGRNATQEEILTMSMGDCRRASERTYPLFVLVEMIPKSNVWELDVVTSKGECEIIWATRKNPDFMRVYAA